MRVAASSAATAMAPDQAVGAKLPARGRILHPQPVQRRQAPRVWVFGADDRIAVFPAGATHRGRRRRAREPVQPAARGYFLFVGRLEKIKGLQDVIPCFEGTQGPELWVVGEGSYEAELRRLAESSSRVRFLGVRTQERLRDLYANAIAVVTPSICYEVFPMVVLEAFREATPIVARKLGPYPEIVEQSGGGMLFESVAELRDALNRLASDGELRDQYGNAGLKAFQAFWHEEPALLCAYHGHRAATQCDRAAEQIGSLMRSKQIQFQRDSESLLIQLVAHRRHVHGSRPCSSPMSRGLRWRYDELLRSSGIPGRETFRRNKKKRE